MESASPQGFALIALTICWHAGTVEGFSYSKANKEKAVHWGEDTLYDYLLVSCCTGCCRPGQELKTLSDVECAQTAH